MEEINFSHRSVLLDECIEALNIRDGYTYIDCTTGGGGHSLEIAKRLTGEGRLICLDRDADAIRAASARLAPYRDRITFIHENYSELARILAEHPEIKLGGVLMDLGCSSYQLDTPERGFSYMNDAPLDMRMDASSPLTAYDVVNDYSEEKLAKIIFEYGEDRFARRIAQRIVAERERSPIETTGRLSDIVKAALPAASREGGHHPAKRTFQAIRIEVNGELDAIEPAIRAAIGSMQPGGRAVIISFHSLEDRAVKQTYASLASGCTCPKDFPVCVCGNKPKIKILTKKPILPTSRELEENPRSRSAKLRVAEKL